MTRYRYTVDITIDDDEQTTTAAIYIGSGPAKLARLETVGGPDLKFNARIGREIVEHSFRLFSAEAQATAPEDVRLLSDGFTVGEHREGKCGGASVCPYCEAEEEASAEVSYPDCTVRQYQAGDLQAEQDEAQRAAQAAGAQDLTLDTCDSCGRPSADLHHVGRNGFDFLCDYCVANPDLEAEAEAAERTAPAYVSGRGEE